MKKVVLIIAVVALLAGFSIQNANADAGWYKCKINSLGQLADMTGIMLTDDGAAFTTRWYVPLASKTKEMLAIAMFASANSRKVWVYLSSITETSTILWIVMEAQ